MEKAKAAIPDIEYCGSPYEAAKGADAILIATEWEEFRAVDWSRMASLVGRPLVLDGRNLLNQTEMAALGFDYIGIGKPSSRAGQRTLTQSIG
jgi:UDPglucose 6-dehydrogenase